MVSSLVRVFALLCVVYVVQSVVLAAGEAQRSRVVDDAPKSVEKRSTDEDKDDDDDHGLRQSLNLLAESQERSRRSFRGDLGKRRSSFRGDLGKRGFRGDLGKRVDIAGYDDDKGPMTQFSAEKRPRSSSFRGDLGKRRSSFRGDLGKRDASLYDYDSSTLWSDGDGDEIGVYWGEDGGRDDFTKRRPVFRGDLGKRRASFRGDLGK